MAFRYGAYAMALIHILVTFSKGEVLKSTAEK